MLAIGEIVSSSQFRESVEIKKCEVFGEYFIIEAIGQETNQYYEIMIEKNKNPMNETSDFSILV